MDCKSKPPKGHGVRRDAAAMAIAVLVAVAFSVLFPRVRHNSWVSYDWASTNASGICRFPAIYNFGDSNSDTGGRSAAFHQLPSLYGEAIFGKSSGRFSDGHVILDFIAEILGLPSISAYLDSIGANFQHGANFATGGSTINPVNGKMFEARFSPFSLEIQLSQFQQFKSRFNELHNGDATGGVDFSKALFTLDIGQNDLTAGFTLTTEEQVKAELPSIIDRFTSVVQQLYQEGARIFWIHNTGPNGCLPFSMMLSEKKPENLDPVGCLNSRNDIAQEFNEQLKEKVSELRTKLREAKLTYVDIYSAKYALIAEAEKHGFVDPLGYCCGRVGVYCGMKTIIDGAEVYGEACSEPSRYISWDGVHYTHAANKWVAHRIADGSFSDPPIPVTKACLGLDHSSLVNEIA